MRKSADALVLRVMQAGDNDRRLLVLTSDEGKLWLTAKGARSVRSKVASLCRIFSYANLEFYEKNGLRWLSGGSLNRDFYGICSDLDDFALASYICELADEISGENMPAEEVLRATLNTLYAIEQKLRPLFQIKAVYELFAASVSGFCPDLFACASCGSETLTGDIWLDIMNGSLICGECLRKRSGNLPLPDTDSFETRNILVPLNSSALSAMRYVLSAPQNRIFAFSLSDVRTAELFSKACEAYLLNHLERDFDTLKFYNSTALKKAVPKGNQK